MKLNHRINSVCVTPFSDKTNARQYLHYIFLLEPDSNHQPPAEPFQNLFNQPYVFIHLFIHILLNLPYSYLVILIRVYGARHFVLRFQQRRRKNYFFVINILAEI